MYTEEDARKKWCPDVTFQIGPVNSSAWQGVAYTNRGTEYSPENCCCIASKCMGWRWVYEELDLRNASGEITERNARVITDRGYCGKYGRP